MGASRLWGARHNASMKLLPHSMQHRRSFAHKKTWPACLLIFSIIAQMLVASARAQSVPRKVVLEDIAAKVISPAYTDLDSKCRALTNAIGQLVHAPNQASLDHARQAWADAAAAANRARYFQAGPIVDREYVATFYYWKVRGSKIDSTIHEARAIDQAFLNEQGADVKGLFTLEYLLFGQAHQSPGEPKPVKTPLELLCGNDAKPRRDFLLLVGHDLESKAAQLAADWSVSGEQGTRGKF